MVLMSSISRGVCRRLGMSSVRYSPVSAHFNSPQRAECVAYPSLVIELELSFVGP